MKRFLKKSIPPFLFDDLRKCYLFFRRKKTQFVFRKMYRNDMYRYLKYSRTYGVDNPTKLIGSIILQYHVIEKGLTMPETKLGFGKEKVISLCKDCLKFISKYGQEDEQVIHAIQVIREYENYHRVNNFVIDEEISLSIMKIKNSLKGEVEMSSQLKTSKTDYFKNVDSSFHDFSNSRSTIRDFSNEEISISRIEKSLELARNTPSACNRQCWRTYVYTEKQTITRLLEAQGGNRGFGHLTNKLILITGELGLFCNTNERNQVFIDGGMYAMNLLYALHSYEIGACILNCSFDFDKEQEIKKFSGVAESQVLIAMIACGIPPDYFKIANSPRYNLEITNRFIY